MNKIKFKEKNVKRYLDERINFWEGGHKDLKENITNDFQAKEKNLLMVSCYIETYKNIRRDIFGK